MIGEEDEDDEEWGGSGGRVGDRAQPPRTEGTSENLAAVRERIGEMLSEGPLTQLVAAEPVLEFVRNQEVPSWPPA